MRYPERSGALVDMRRCISLLAGASWLAEYGDPDEAEDWKWLKTYSAYHGARPG
ncbi:prolyl oligopeptidase PreP (S9A serine peptidase family) [Bradyrhizobium sp. RT6a]|uniref:hypothetical protein n=1 Tax=Bradyrhizobium sp. RT6a TaxID=3156381 RepID=UPI003396BA4F